MGREAVRDRSGKATNAYQNRRVPWNPNGILQTLNNLANLLKDQGQYGQIAINMAIVVEIAGNRHLSNVTLPVVYSRDRFHL